MMSVCAWTGLDKSSRSACAILAGMRRAFAESLYAHISITERGYFGSVAKDKVKAHEYWLLAVEIMRRHDSTVGSGPQM